jgi:hypothetical protein
MVDVAAGRLLRTHVGWCSQRDPRFGELLGGDYVYGTGNAEVGEYGAAVFH